MTDIMSQNLKAIYPFTECAIRSLQAGDDICRFPLKRDELMSYVFGLSEIIYITQQK